MITNSGKSAKKSQGEKFREAARELETDQSERAFDKIVKRVAKGPPSSKRSKSADKADRK